MDSLLPHIWPRVFLALFATGFGGLPGLTEVVAPVGPRVTIAVGKDKVIQREPVAVFVQLKNQTAKKLTVPASLELEYGTLVYDITGPDGKVQRFRPAMSVLQESLDVRVLDAGESLRHNEVLLYSTDRGFYFSEPGKYRIQAAIHSRGPDQGPVVFRSNHAHVIVLSATGSEASAMERFAGHPQGKFAIGSSRDHAIADEFRAVIEKYPDSTYAPWCYFFQARAWQRRFQEDTPKVAAERAIALYEELLEKHPKFPLAVEVRYYIARELLSLDKRSEGLERIEKLIAEHPDLRLLQRAKRAIEGLRKAGAEITAAQLP